MNQSASDTSRLAQWLSFENVLKGVLSSLQNDPEVDWERCFNVVQQCIDGVLDTYRIHDPTAVKNSKGKAAVDDLVEVLVGLRSRNRQRALTMLQTAMQE